MVTAGATVNTTEENSRTSRESGLLCSHSQTVYNTKGTRTHTHRDGEAIGIYCPDLIRSRELVKLPDRTWRPYAALWVVARRRRLSSMSLPPLAQPLHRRAQPLPAEAPLPRAHPLERVARDGARGVLREGRKRGLSKCPFHR